MKGPRWKKQERHLEQEGARRQPASGSGTLRGDNKGSHFLVSAKSTQNKSYSLKRADLQKMIDDAHIEDRLPVMQVELDHDPDQQYAVLRWRDFLAILEDAGMSL